MDNTLENLVAEFLKPIVTRVVENILAEKDLVSTAGLEATIKELVDNELDGDDFTDKVDNIVERKLEDVTVDVTAELSF